MFNCLVSNDPGKINFMKKKLFLGTVFSKKELYFPPVTHCPQVWFRERAAFQNTVETSVYVRDGCQGRGGYSSTIRVLKKMLMSVCRYWEGFVHCSAEMDRRTKL